MMETLDTREDKSMYLSPKANLKTKRCPRPSVLSSRKYFRKSMKHNRVEHTMPNKSISVIEISSTDSESFKNADSCAEIDESDIQDSKILNTNYLSVSKEIISPSPNKNNINLKCLSIGKKRGNNVNINRNKINKQNVKNEKELSDNKKEANAYLDLSVLDYDKFQNATYTSNSLMNSTMIQPEVKPNLLETDVQYNLNTSVEAVNKSDENLLDDLYGDSWRPYKEKILPSSEKKPSIKRILVEKQMPATERKLKKSEIYKNPYTDNEKHKSNDLLKALHTKRIREAIEPPLIQTRAPKIKSLCDKDSSEQSDVGQPPQKPRIKLIFNENKESLEDNEQNNLKESNTPMSINDNDFYWSDKENSSENLPLKNRIIRRNLTKEKKLNDLDQAKDNTARSKRELLSLDDNINDVVPAKISSSGLSFESNNEGVKQRTPKLNKNELRYKKNHKNYWETLSSSHESINDSDGNIVLDIKGRTMNNTNSKKSFVSNPSDGIEVGKKIATLEGNPSSNYNFTNIVKKVTKELSKTKIVSSSNEECNEIPNLKKTDPKNNKISKKKTKTNFRDNTSDSDDSLLGYKTKLELKKNDEIKTFSFLASLSIGVPDHQCDPSAKIFKANFKNNKETLAKKLFELYNENIFNNLLPKSLPLEWNARMVATAGYCHSKRVTHRDGRVDMEACIVLSTKVLTTPDRLRDTIIHEMCHAATWLIDKVRDGHGQYWKAWAMKAKKTYPELPPIKTCHNYELLAKYVYKCSDCGYEVKRHRKSLDIERKRCGYCCGKFLIFMNKVNKKGETKMIPLANTPKKEPKGFAAFYQENYPYYKTSRNTPAQVMKLLSDKFKELKVQ